MDSINLEYTLLIAGTFLVVSILSLIIRKALSAIINKNSEVLGVSPTTFVFIKNSTSFILYSIGICWVFYKIPYFNSLGSALFAGAGVFAAVIAFASQKAFSNIIGGIFILIFKPFRVGDIVEVTNTKGKVEEITLRHTIIRDYEFRRIVIPNSIISDEVIINSSIIDEKIRKRIEFGIAYGADVDLAKKIIIEEICKHPDCIDNRTPEEKKNNKEIVKIDMTQWGDFSVTLRAYVWANGNDVAYDLSCDVLDAVKKRFDQNSIEIPFPHRTIIVKNKEQNEFSTN